MRRYFVWQLSLVFHETAQQSVHRTGGYAPRFQACSLAQNSTVKIVLPKPSRQPVTHTVRCFVRDKKMIAGISKSQWLLIMVSETIVLLINGFGMWEKDLLYESRRLHLPELYKVYDCGTPWPKVIPETMVTTTLLLLIAWLIVFMSRQLFFQKLPLKLKIGSQGLIAIFVGIIFMIASISFSDSWVFDFWCGDLYGLLYSSSVRFLSVWLILPATSLLIFWATYISNPRINREIVPA